MKNESLNDTLLQLCIEELDNCSKEELTRMMAESDLNLEQEYNSVTQGIESTILQHKKNKLNEARKAYADSSNVEQIERKFENAKSKMIALIQSGIAPAEITMAFRNGEDISEEEMSSILQDLIDLGLDIDEM